MIAIGLIGCGTVAHTNYAKTLIGRDAYKVQFVCDTNRSQAESAAALFGAEVVSLSTLAERADAIVVSTPPSTHATLVDASLRPGRTIICEKPFMTSFADAQGVCEAARASGAHLYVGHFRRVFPQLVLARDLVGLGVIGEVSGLRASEGGRFTWKAISNYTTEDPAGGVLWDTGAHTLDMALFAACLDGSQTIDVGEVRVERDKAEPSHDFSADFELSVDGLAIEARIHVSRREALPNLITITGTLGELTFVAGVDDRVRLTTPKGTTVIRAGEQVLPELMEYFDLQVRNILLAEGAEPFLAENFVGQIKIMEALANA